jgi:hypothetical protein
MYNVVAASGKRARLGASMRQDRARRRQAVCQACQYNQAARIR